MPAQGGHDGVGLFLFIVIPLQNGIRLVSLSDSGFRRNDNLKNFVTSLLRCRKGLGRVVNLVSSTLIIERMT